MVPYQLTSCKTSGVRTSFATSSTDETRNSAGKCFSTHSLCRWAIESSGVHSLSARFSCVNLKAPIRHPPQMANEIMIVIQGLPPTAFPRLKKVNRHIILKNFTKTAMSFVYYIFGGFCPYRGGRAFWNMEGLIIKSCACLYLYFPNVFVRLHKQTSLRCLQCLM